ncbi:hypothetical protein ABZ370_30205 [Streptomyces sp. NPDC005962]|uniref:hypothetical protein n=1 Tax=Streptomyces sp. NPDC005962 TaxID=3154466 RepID=UPI0033C18FA2
MELLTSSCPPKELTCTLLADGPYALCELGEHSDTLHAHHIWDDDTAIWLMWDSGEHNFVRMPSCEVLSPDDDECVCYFHQNHPGSHSWALTDPVRDALRTEVEREAGDD